MPRIDIDVQDRYDGSSLRRSSEDVRTLTRDVQNLSRALSQVSEGRGSSGSGIMADVNAEIEKVGGIQAYAARATAAIAAPASIGQGFGAAAAAQATAIVNIGTAAGKAREQITTLKKELEALKTLQNSPTSAGIRQATQILGSDDKRVQQVLSKAGDSNAVAELEQKIAAAEAAERQAAERLKFRRVREPSEILERDWISAQGEDKTRRQRQAREEMELQGFFAAEDARQQARQMKRVRPGEEIEQARIQAEAEDRVRGERRAKTEAGLQNFLAAEEAKEQARQRRRVRPGEEIDHAHAIALGENRRRDRQSFSAAESAQRRAEGEQRRSNFDSFLAAGMLGGISRAAFAPLAMGQEAFGREQMARVGLSAMGDPDQLMKSSRQDAANIFGADYKDVANFRSQLHNAGETADDAARSVRALADATAAAGRKGDVLERVIANLAQVDTQAKLSARDLKDFEVNGIAATRLIAQEMGITTSELRDRMRKGEVTGTEARQALVAGIEKDPTLAGRSKALSDTPTGRIEKVSERSEAVSADMARALQPATNALLGLAEKGLGFLEAHPTLTGALGYGAAGVGVLSGAGSLYHGARAGAGVLGQAMPGLQNIPGIGGFFGGEPMDHAASSLETAAINLNAAAGKIGAGGGGGLSNLLEQAGENALEEVGENGVKKGAAGRGAWMRGGLGAAATFLSQPLMVAGRTIPVAPGALGSTGSLTGVATVGGTAASAAIGAAAGYGVYDDRAMVGDKYAGIEGAATGVAAAAAAMFLPGAAVPIALAAGIRYMFNQGFNVPLEQEAEMGLNERTKDEYIAKNGPLNSWDSRANEAKERAARLQAEADGISTTLDFYGDDRQRKRDLENEAASARSDWRTYSRHARQESNPRYQADQQRQKELDDWTRAANIRNQPEVITNNPKGRVTNVNHNQDLSQTITLTLPAHPQVAGVVNDVNDYTRPR